MVLRRLLAFGPFLAASVHGDDLFFDRAPYLQQLTETSVLIVSQSQVQQTSTLRYGPCDQLDTVLESAVPAHEHTFRLEQLAPDTDYCYEWSSGVRRRESSFRTLPGPGGEVKVAVLGDSGTGSPEQRAVAAVLEAIDPDIVLHTGDLVYPGGLPTLYQRFFFEIYQDLLSTACVFPAPGNHDCLFDVGFFRDAFQPPSNGLEEEWPYSFDAGAAHFVALSTCAELSTEQSEWLERDLASTDRVWKIVYFHHPPYSNARHGGDPRVRRDIVPLLERHDVDLVFSGHEHAYERSYPIRQGHIRDGYHDPEFVDPDGVIYVVTGGGGAALYPRQTRHGDLRFTPRLSAAFHSAHHAVSLRITDTKLVVEAIGSGNEILDSFSLQTGAVRPDFSFVLGDSNTSGSVEVTDSIVLLKYLFVGQTEACLPASDVNRDGEVSVTDAIRVLTYLFLDATGMPASFGTCTDGDLEPVGCVRSCG